jgi:hypothetical protein
LGKDVIHNENKFCIKIFHRYREILDRWQLWHQRARFDMGRIDPIPPQIYVRCNYCNQPLSFGRIVPRRTAASTPSSTARSGGLSSHTTGSKQTTQKQKAFQILYFCLLSKIAVQLPELQKVITSLLSVPLIVQL